MRPFFPLVLLAPFLLLPGGAPAGAGEPFDDAAVRHRQALSLFEDACLSQAPDFVTTPVIFQAMGFQRPPEMTAFRLPERGLYGGVVAMQAGEVLGRQCSVLIEDGKLPVLVLGLRSALARLSQPGSLKETAPAFHTDPVLWDFELDGIGLVSVTAGMSAQGIAVMGMQVADRGMGHVSGLQPDAATDEAAQ
ncbi:MAG: hypothetical protein AAGD47_10130 [Pseudomonadota bacterium]